MNANGKHFKLHRLVLLAVSAVIATLICLFGQVACWHDSVTYIIHALYLFDPFARQIIGDRDPAYPILIWLSGYPLTLSVHNLLIIQAVMAALTPLLVCCIMQNISPRMGLIAGWLSILTGIAFVFQTQIFSDQLHVFLLLLATLAAVRCFYSPKPWPIYGLALTTGLLSLCRPTYWMLLIAAAAIGWLWAIRRKGEGRGYAAHCVIALVIMADLLIAGVWERNQVNEARAAEGLPPIRSSVMGRQLMQNTYRFGAGMSEAYNENDGPATQEFVRRGILTMARCGQMFGSYKACEGMSVLRKLQAAGTLEQSLSTAEGAFRTFFYYPRYLGWGYFTDVYGRPYWQTPEDEKLLVKVYVEQMLHHPRMFARMILTGLNELVLSSYYDYSLDDEYGYEPFNYDGRKVPNIAFMPVQRIENCHFEPEIGEYANYRYISADTAQTIQRIFELTYRPFTIVTGLGFLLAALWYGVTALRARQWGNETLAFFILFTFYWLPNGLMIFMVMMQFRYQAATALLPMMGTLMLLRRLWQYGEARHRIRLK